MNRHEVRAPLQFFNDHSLTLGGSGCGKTTKALWLLLQIIPLVSGCWCFDFRKREYTKIRPALSRLGIELICAPGRKLRLNPLQVPSHVHPQAWASQIADILVAVLRLPQRASKLIHTTILLLYKKFDIILGSRKFPLLVELRNTIANNSGANPQAKHAVVDALDPILISLGDVLCYRFGWTTEELAKRRIVFELGGLAETDKDLILNFLLGSEFASRISRGISNVRMDLFISCDEAGRMISASGGSYGLADAMSTIRGTGLGVDLSLQSADIAPSILSNASFKCIGRCGSANDLDIMAAAMGLTLEQKRFLNTTLVPGVFLGQLGEGWRQPFLFRVPKMNFNNQDSNFGHDSSLGDLKRLPVF